MKKENRLTMKENNCEKRISMAFSKKQYEEIVKHFITGGNVRLATICKKLILDRIERQNRAKKYKQLNLFKK